ncbi:MAG: DUF58 domain-containing protein [Verrucomicrobiales bacterium]
MLAPLSSLPYMSLLPEQTTSVVTRLEFMARGKMQGSLSGRHSSPNKGFSVIFAEHRPYSPGDSLRTLDWRVWGKSDRYYIKQYIEETNLRATILLDASGSMNYRGEAASAVAGKKVSKFEFAQYLAAGLTYLLVRQQDAVGLVTFDEKLRQFIRAASRPSQVRRILEELHKTNAGGDTALAATLHEVAERIPSRGLILLISDLFDAPEKIVESLHHFRFNGHEIVVFHVMADEELTFPFRDFNDFRDLEGADRRLKIDPRSVRAAYLDKVRAHIQHIERGCGQLRADYVPVNTKENYSKVLVDYLARRVVR